jgi:nicotinate dehydrogenase subunit A
MADRTRLTVNGLAREIEAPADMPLLYALRNHLGLQGPRFGCGLAQCGACTVLVGGAAVRSCAAPLAAVAGQDVTTLEGLGTPEKPHPVQAAFIAEEALFCGYCSNGWMISAAALLQENPRRSDAEIRTALADLKCRCGAHMAMLRAIKRAAHEMS